MLWINRLKLSPRVETSVLLAYKSISSSEEKEAMHRNEYFSAQRFGKV